MKPSGLNANLNGQPVVIPILTSSLPFILKNIHFDTFSFGLTE